MGTKPIVRWVGGKTQLLPEIRRRVPALSGTYFEPFLGGAAVLLNLSPSKAVVSDANKELINFYLVARESPEDLVAAALSLPNSAEFYYEIRARDRLPNFSLSPRFDRAVRFLYMRKTGFNGLWRVNEKKGYNNTPYGFPKQINIDVEKFKEFSAAVRSVDFRCLDFEELLGEASAGDFVYLDPPYWDTFSSYTAAGFSLADQFRLRDCCLALRERGVEFLLSMSDVGPARDAYCGFNIETVEVTQTVGARSKSRGRKTELFIS